MERRFRYATLIVLGAFLLTVWSTSAFSQKNETSKLFVNSTEVEVGETLEGKDIAYTFHLRNHGKAELEIISVKPG